MTGDAPRPRLLQIVREGVTPGGEADYDAIEAARARACATFGCPHPHVGLATVRSPLAVWWLNAFASNDDRRRVEAAYASNAPLMEALMSDSARKATLASQTANLVVTYDAGASAADVWPPTGAPLWVALEGGEVPAGRGAVFAAEDGVRVVFVPARTLEDADRVVAMLGPSATVLEVRPQWGMPARSWIAADPQRWAASSSASAGSASAG